MERVYKWLWSFDQKFVDLVKDLGDCLRYSPVIYLLVLLFEQNWHELLVYLIALAVALGLMQLLKFMFNNPRPRETEGYINPPLNLEWSPHEGDSFISGHVVGAMFGGVWLFQVNDLCGVFGIAIGLVTAFSRLITKAHWLRDVIAGSILPIVVYVISLNFLR